MSPMPCGVLLSDRPLLMRPGEVLRDRWFTALQVVQCSGDRAAAALETFTEVWVGDRRDGGDAFTEAFSAQLGDAPFGDYDIAARRRHHRAGQPRHDAAQRAVARGRRQQHDRTAAGRAVCTPYEIDLA